MRRFPTVLVLAALLSGAAYSDVAASAEKTAKEVPVTQGNAADLEFTGFHKPRELLGDPYEFSSPDARVLWEQVVRYSQGTSDSFGSMLMQGGDYVAVGDGCFLVRYAAIQFTCLGSDAVQELTPWSPPGNTEVVAVRALQTGGWWALVKTGKLSRGVVSESYHVMIGMRVDDTVSVRSKALVRSTSEAGEDGNVCRGLRVAAVKVASKILSFDVRGRSDGDEVSFRILQTDCLSGRTERLTRRYRIAAGDALPLR